MTAITRSAVTVLIIFLACTNGWAFEKKDLETQKKRRAFFQKGNYAIGIMKAALGTKPKARSSKVLVYYVSDTAYDCIYTFNMLAPLVMDRADERIALTSKGTSFKADRTLRLVLSSEGVALSEHYEFPEDAGGFPLLYPELSTARFLDTDVYHVRGEGIERMTLNG